MRRNALLVCVFAASGCNLPAGGSGGRDCSKVMLDSASIKTGVLAASAENGFDLRPYDRVLGELVALGKECKLPGGDLGDLRMKLEQAGADQNVTHDELRPVLVRVDELVASATGKSVAVALVLDEKGVLTAPPPDIKVGNCPLPAHQPFDNFPFRGRALRDAPPAQVAHAAKIDEMSQTAAGNLVALAQAEVAHHAKHGTYLPFVTGDDATWKELGVTLPRPAKHSLSAAITKEGFRILAEGNLDDDAFLDRWLIEHRTGAEGCPPANVLAADSIDATFEDGPARLVPRGLEQPKRRLP